MQQLFDQYILESSRTSTGRTITEADIVLHAGQTGDFYPHHMDAEWCKTQEFGQRVAHGTLILSVAVGMLAGEINEAAFSYGYLSATQLHLRQRLSQRKITLRSQMSTA